MLAKKSNGIKYCVSCIAAEEIDKCVKIIIAAAPQKKALSMMNQGRESYGTVL